MRDSDEILDPDKAILDLYKEIGLPPAVAKEITKIPAKDRVQFFMEYSQNRKTLGKAYFLCLTLGGHYFYVQQWTLQILFWLTMGGMGVWWFIDIFRVPGMVSQYNEEAGLKIIRRIKTANFMSKYT